MVCGHLMPADHTDPSPPVKAIRTRPAMIACPTRMLILTPEVVLGRADARRAFPPWSHLSDSTHRTPANWHLQPSNCDGGTVRSPRSRPARTSRPSSRSGVTDLLRLATGQRRTSCGSQLGSHHRQT
jgi:hypothetical protein